MSQAYLKKFGFPPAPRLVQQSNVFRPGISALVLVLQQYLNFAAMRVEDEMAIRRVEIRILVGGS